MGPLLQKKLGVCEKLKKNFEKDHFNRILIFKNILTVQNWILSVLDGNTKPFWIHGQSEDNSVRQSEDNSVQKRGSGNSKIAKSITLYLCIVFGSLKY